MRRPPIDVHVARYAADGAHGRGPSVWLATVLAPSDSAILLGWPLGWPHGSPLQHLVDELLAGIEPHHFDDGTPMGTLVLLPTGTDDLYTTRAGLVRLVDLYRSVTGRQDPAEERVHRRLRQLPVHADEIRDIAAAIGHRLPWWPTGCATPALATAWEPGTQMTEPIPPPLAEADTFRRRCEAAAADLDGDLAVSVRELGNCRWGSASDSWRPGYASDLGVLPKDCDPAVWQVAVRFSLGPERHSWNGDSGRAWSGSWSTPPPGAWPAMPTAFSAIPTAPALSCSTPPHSPPRSLQP